MLARIDSVSMMLVNIRSPCNLGGLTRADWRLLCALLNLLVLMR